MSDNLLQRHVGCPRTRGPRRGLIAALRAIASVSARRNQAARLQGHKALEVATVRRAVDQAVVLTARYPAT